MRVSGGGAHAVCVGVWDAQVCTGMQGSGRASQLSLPPQPAAWRTDLGSRAPPHGAGALCGRGRVEPNPPACPQPGEEQVNAARAGRTERPESCGPPRSPERHQSSVSVARR